MFQLVFHNTRLHLALLLSLCSLLFFPFLGARDFWELENQYAEAVRVMLLDGNYFYPKVNDTLWTESPPLFFWFAALFSLLAGGTSEWSLRLPSALSATELVLVFYYFVRKRFGAELALIAAVILSTSVLTTHVERHVQVDMMFYLFIILSLFLFLEILAFDSFRLSHAYGAWFFMGLACLTNGPMGILIPALVVCSYLVLSRRWNKFSALRPVAGVLLLLGMTAPWFAYLAWKTSGTGLDAIFIHLRYTAHAGPDHQLFFRFPLAFTPWCFLIVPAAISLWRDRSKLRDPAVLFLFLWFAVTLLFSEFTLGHHNHYLFLAYVPAAVGLAAYLTKVPSLEPYDRVRVWTHRSVWFFCAIFVLGALSGPMIVAHNWPFLAAPMGAVGVAVVALSICVFYGWKRFNHYGLICGFAALPVVANLPLQTLVFPALNQIKLRPLSEKIGSVIDARSQVGIYRPRTFHDFNYYSQIKKFEVLRRDEEVANFLNRPGSQFLLLKRRNLDAIKKAWPGDARIVFRGAIGSEQWLLLHTCNAGCESTPVYAEIKNPLVNYSLTGAHEHDGREGPAGTE